MHESKASEIYIDKLKDIVQENNHPKKSFFPTFNYCIKLKTESISGIPEFRIQTKYYRDLYELHLKSRKECFVEIYLLLMIMNILITVRKKYIKS